MGMGVIGFDGSGSVGDATTSRGDGERNDDNVLFRVKSLDCEPLLVLRLNDSSLLLRFLISLLLSYNVSASLIVIMCGDRGVLF
jgi:hypothetical protein